jgi:hypothetical protein
VHDSQLAIQMEKMTEGKIFFCYSLMDAAYDSSVIDRFIRSWERIPIINSNNRGNETRAPLDPAKQGTVQAEDGSRAGERYIKGLASSPETVYKGTYKSFVRIIECRCLSCRSTNDSIFCPLARGFGKGSIK